MKINSLHQLLCIMLFCLVVFACGKQAETDTAAPLDDKKTLEILAKAYEKISESMPASPVSLRPEARKKFVLEVFKEAGFSYGATMASLADVETENVTQFHRDMKELLFLPHYGFRFDEVKSIYSENEIESIIEITANVK